MEIFESELEREVRELRAEREIYTSKRQELEESLRLKESLILDLQEKINTYDFLPEVKQKRIAILSAEKSRIDAISLDLADKIRKIEES